MFKIGYPSPAYEDDLLPTQLAEPSPSEMTTDGYGATTGYTAGSAN